MLSAAEVRNSGDATDEQRAALHTLLDTKAVDPRWRDKFFTSVRRAGGLTSCAAGDALIYLRSLADRDQQPAQATPAQADAMRWLLRSRIVPAAIGRRLLARYTSGELTYVQADRAIREWLAMAPSQIIAASDLPAPAGTRAPDGYFAITIADGTARCYRIHTLPLTREQLVEQITTDSGKTRKLHRSEAYLVLREVAASPAAAAKMYGETRHRCSHCNQPLRDETQPGHPHGYGPDCWAEIQAARAAGS